MSLYSELRSLDQIPLTRLKGVGAALAGKLEKLGLESLQDLLFHLPIRYQDRTRIKPIGELRPGDEVVIQGRVRNCDLVHGRRRSLRCQIQDDTGSVSLRFFHFSAAQKNNLKPGIEIRCFGEARVGSGGLEFYHPEYRQLSDEEASPVAQNLTPIYPATEGITQPRIRGLCEQALDMMERQGGLKDWLPEVLQRRHQLMGLNEAVRYLHRPPVEADVYQLSEERHPAQRRLAFEELLAHHLSLLRLRHQHQSQGAPALVVNMGSMAVDNAAVDRSASDSTKGPVPLVEQFLAQLSFQLTGAQKRVYAEVARDLSQPLPMLRLVQGDVGSGKTVIAALAALQAIDCGYQAAVMAPTEILAEQHFLNFTSWFEPLGLQVDWLAGKLKGKKRIMALERIAGGEAQVVVGTHALFQQDVKFSHLALVVVDEQHRFGVHQRLALREKGSQQGRLPHQLIMTATPIPRTLTMSAYADLDCSIIDELPAGRSPVNTALISDQRRQEVISRVRVACGEGRQAYWVCTLIDESEVLECQAAEATAEELTRMLPELRIGLVHGRLKAAEKAEIMAAFKAHQLDLLVATTVIEVGVDVPNASLMIIENPERLGLAQLHQLRGRVGRGMVASHCVLMYHAPLSQQGQERLRVMRETTDGFRIAEKDLEIRGPGEVLGTRQTGMMQFRVANLERDADLLTQVKAIAGQMDSAPENCDAIIRRWLGRGEQYGGV
ncbi:ATP-dependent DNA helicase RecG [Motiliproteus sp. MSK22-1]|uniref:ATP-dependent DNA helicase RecG n=1 Tax=Motiliproteus sp. MSK22-1 TaxID=1897630 RepID=UPI0009759F5E|nr:ATP-dependent DNA helicase RecG [Motiliproteus sp. MSK22-1]OMH39658.1 ATP-dependent DNA helicase RecG [Motiliproteus sp. MSK22-1]